MENQNQPQGTTKDLFQVFTRPLKSLWKGIKKYAATSFLIFRFKGLPEQIHSPKDGHHRDVNYAFATFEFLLIFIVGTAILGIGSDLGELGEGVRDIFVLISYFLIVLIFIGFSRLWRSTFGITLPSRIIDAFFIYEFSFLFLPSYLIMYPFFISVGGDDESIGGLGILLSLFWLAHMIYFYYRMSKFLKLGWFKTFMSIVLLCSISLVLLFISVFFVIGIAIGE